MEPTLEQQVQYLSSQIQEIAARVAVLEDYRTTSNERNVRAFSVPRQAPVQEATPRQIRYLYAVARELGIDADALEECCQRLYGVGVSEVNRRDCSNLIESIQLEQGLPS